VLTTIFNLSLAESMVPVCFKWSTIVRAQDCISSLNDDICAFKDDIKDDQVIRVGRHTSGPLTLNTGFPQGCVLSPLLHSLFTHDCVARSSSNTIVKFVNDTVTMRRPT